MSKFTSIIIEDEPLALERTKEFVLKIPFLNLAATFDNAIHGLHYLQANNVDILFLDINMDELTGIELLENSKILSQVIFTTAYQEYALKGYELNVTDYLLKPFTFNRFLQAVNKAVDNIKKTMTTGEVEYVFVKTENILKKVMLGDILYIEGMRDYRRIHLGHSSIMTLQTFTELEQIIPSTIISRVHKSYMVALSKIDSIERSKILIGEKIIPISNTYRASFLALINKN